MSVFKLASISRVPSSSIHVPRTLFRNQEHYQSGSLKTATCCRPNKLAALYTVFPNLQASKTLRDPVIQHTFQNNHITTLCPNRDSTIIIHSYTHKTQKLISITNSRLNSYMIAKEKSLQTSIYFTFMSTFTATKSV